MAASISISEMRLCSKRSNACIVKNTPKFRKIKHKFLYGNDMRTRLEKIGKMAEIAEAAFLTQPPESATMGG